MNFELSEEQKMIQQSVERFVQENYDLPKRVEISSKDPGYNKEYWGSMAELGWLGLPFEEKDGGFGGNQIDTLVIMEQFGKGLVVEPYMPSIILAGGLISKLGSADQKNLIIPEIISGDRRYVFAYAEPQSRFDLFDVKCSATLDGDNYIINGFKSVVFGAGMATHLIISARTEGDQRSKSGITLFLVDIKSDGITLQNYPTIDEYRASEVVIENLTVSKENILGELGNSYEAIEEQVDLSTIAICSEAVGILQVLKDSTNDYCKNRKQFGQSISANQAIQHRLVDMMIEYEQAKSILYMAITADLSNSDERRKAASAAKARIGKAIKFVGENAIQLHGGMGVVDEYMISHFFKRATMIGILFGNVDFHMKRYTDLTQSNIQSINEDDGINLS